MKKRIFVLAAFCLMLSACGDKAGDFSTDAPEPLSQTEQVSPASNDASESASEPASEPDELPDEPVSEPDHRNSVPVKVDQILVGNGFEEGTVFVLNDEEREALRLLMRMDDWEVASDLPTRGFASEFILYEEEQIWFFNRFESQTLIVPSFPDQNGDKVCYFAPADVISDILAYTETLTPQPAS